MQIDSVGCCNVTSSNHRVPYPFSTRCGIDSGIGHLVLLYPCLESMGGCICVRLLLATSLCRWTLQGCTVTSSRYRTTLKVPCIDVSFRHEHLVFEGGVQVTANVVHICKSAQQDCTAPGLLLICFPIT